VDYRLYRSGDFDAVYAIEVACFKPPFRFGHKCMKQLVIRADAATWVAEESGCLQGFAIVEWARDAGGVAAYIATIEVMPGLRGNGVGGELLRKLEGSAVGAGAKELWLHVDAENSGAIRLYQVHGYRCEGREEDFYPNGRAALVFSKPLGTGLG
jgi:ribosomal protein S18 acetylase RimI-like enzyme